MVARRSIIQRIDTLDKKRLQNSVSDIMYNDLNWSLHLDGVYCFQQNNIFLVSTHEGQLWRFLRAI